MSFRTGFDKVAKVTPKKLVRVGNAAHKALTATGASIAIGSLFAKKKEKS